MHTNVEALRGIAQNLRENGHWKGADEVVTAIAEIERLRNANVGADVGSDAARDVLAERRRQIEAEGWSIEHDDRHTLGELGLAAALYALPYDAKVRGEELITQDCFIGLDMALEISCGWSLKPEPNARRRLVKSGALIVAEIERLDRAVERTVKRSVPPPTPGREWHGPSHPSYRNDFRYTD